MSEILLSLIIGMPIIYLLGKYFHIVLLVGIYGLLGFAAIMIGTLILKIFGVEI